MTQRLSKVLILLIFQKMTQYFSKNINIIFMMILIINGHSLIRQSSGTPCEAPLLKDLSCAEPADGSPQGRLLEDGLPGNPSDRFLGNF